MPDLFNKLEWVEKDQPGATAATVARGPARWEAALDALDAKQQELEERIAALESDGGGGAGTVGGLIPRGPSSGRGAPTAGKPYIDTDLDADGKLILGTGSGWAYPDGTLVTGAGSSGAPTNLQAVGQANNSIILTWDAYPGALVGDTIRIHTIDNPGGVADLAGTAVTSTRGPFTRMGDYEYWLTFIPVATGVASAESNHAQLTLPIPGGDEPGGGGDPAPAFAHKINGLNGGTGGNWNLGVGKPSGHVDISWEALKTYSDPYYYRYNPATQAVAMRVPMNGGKTSPKTNYPRVEYREYMPDGTTKMTFRANNGTHVLEGTTRAVHFAPVKKEVCIAQLHDGPDDRWQIRIENTNIVIKCNERGDINVFDETVATVAVGTFFDWRVEMVNGITKFYINDVLEHTDSTSFVNDSTDDQYFKTGCYAQQNVAVGNPADEYCEIEMKDVFASHSTTS